MLEGWLPGWKRIARYIRMSISTAKRYHYDYGMPVKRGPRGTPIALPGEVDGWLVTFDELKKDYREEREEQKLLSYWLRKAKKEKIN